VTQTTADKLKMAFGIVLYLSIALLLPITVRLFGVYSDQPLTYPHLAVPFIMIPYIMGISYRMFRAPWRLLLWCPAVIMLALTVLSIIDGVMKHQFLEQDLIFWPLLIGSYLSFSYIGKRTRDRMI